MTATFKSFLFVKICFKRVFLPAPKKPKHTEKNQYIYIYYIIQVITNYINYSYICIPEINETEINCFLFFFSLLVGFEAALLSSSSAPALFIVRLDSFLVLWSDSGDCRVAADALVMELNVA